MFRLLMCVAMCVVMMNSVYADTMRNVKFFQRVVSEREGVIFEGVTWMKDGLVRVNYDAGPETYSSIIRDGKVYNFSTESRAGVVSQKTEPRFQFGPEIMQSREKMNQFLIAVDAKVVRQETYEGFDCDVYEYTFQEGQSLVKNQLWLWKEQVFPLKTLMEIKDKDVITIYYDKIRINREIKDSQFVVPDNIRFYPE